MRAQRTNLLGALIVLAVGALVSSCTAAGASFGAEAAIRDSRPEDMGAVVELDPANHGGVEPGAVAHVLVISVDGLGSRAVRELGPPGASTLHRMARDGASTLNARNMTGNTTTLPNHMSMVTGRPVEGPGGHGLTLNADSGQTVHEYAGEYVESVFGVVHDHGGSTALLATKEKLDVVSRSWDMAHGKPDRVGRDDGSNKVDRHVVGGDQDVVDELVSLLREDAPTLAVIHLGAPDKAGHEFGWMSEEYLDAVRASDARIGTILDAIESDPALLSSSVVVVTADHGGVGLDHSDSDDPRNFTIPFYAWGSQVGPGEDLYDLNRGTRADPGAGRPRIGDRAPVWNADVANLATDLLGLPSINGSVLNSDQTLRLH